MTAALILFDLAVVWAGSLLVPPFGRCCRALLVSRELPTGKHRHVMAATFSCPGRPVWLLCDRAFTGHMWITIWA